jgi:hypothetical protein
MTEICARCFSKFPIEKMKEVYEAFYCIDCQDTHAGYLCENCYKGEELCRLL